MVALKTPHLDYAIKTEETTYKLVTVTSIEPSTHSQLIFDFCQLCLQIKKDAPRLTYGDMLAGLTIELTEKYSLDITVDTLHNKVPRAQKYNIVKATDILLPVQ